MSLEIPYRSIPDMLAQRVAATPDARAFGYPTPDGGIGWMSWSEVGARATNIAAGLLGLGIRPEDRVAILSNTRVEWLLADFGIMNAGGATTTVYPTTEPEEAAFIVRDSESVVLIAENATQAMKVSGANLEFLRQIVIIDDPGADGDGGAASAGVPVMSLAQLERRGAEALSTDPDLVARAVAAVEPRHLATLIYTSGTTGRPKGVELLHAGWCWEAVAQGENGLVTPDDLQYLWLPLSHSFGKTLACSLVHAGLPTYVDGRVDKLVVNLAAVRPTLMCAAPRVFEKVYNAAVTSATSAGGAKAAIFSWAVRVGRRVIALKLAGKPVPAGLAAQQRVADKLVFSKLRERLGGRIRVLVSGAAPLSRDIAEFFAAAGLPIFEGYGLTETSAGNFVNPLDGLRIGTVGQHLGDLECKIDVDGEILVRGLPVMRGYHHLPDETAAAFTEDGFFRTGDIGELDADGYLRITDRKKDLIKTSGGKYVAPSHIEGMFKAICPFTSQALVIGQARNFCTMIITLDPDAIRAWTAGGPLDGKPYAEVAQSVEARELIGGYVTALNEKLNRWETIKKFAILSRDLSIEDGELTPSLKVKRRSVEAAFASDIEAMYEGTLVEL
jgi:long-chain acyl-CoA synthetase